MPIHAYPEASIHVYYIYKFQIYIEIIITTFLLLFINFELFSEIYVVLHFPL